MNGTNGNKKIVTVQISIPNEGHTPIEGYDNRICMGFHLGGLQLASHIGIKEYDGLKYEYPDGVEFKFYWSSIGRVLTPLARERLAEWAIETKVDYMLFIDDDMICPMDLFEKLYRHDVDVVAPLAFMRMPPHSPVMYRVEDGYDPLQRMEYYTTHVVKNYPKNRLVECDAVGFGAALIKTDVLRRMPQPWFMSTTRSGEDLWFCYKAKKDAGARIFMDTSVKLGHIGMAPIIEEKDYEEHNNVGEHRKVYGDWMGLKMNKEPVIAKEN
jgi:hypothetical protein